MCARNSITCLEGGGPMKVRLSQGCISLLFERRISRESCFSVRTAEGPFILDTQLPQHMPRVRCYGSASIWHLFYPPPLHPGLRADRVLTVAHDVAGIR